MSAHFRELFPEVKVMHTYKLTKARENLPVVTLTYAGCT